MLYQIKDGTLSPGGHEVLSHIDFHIRGKEKLALVGANGAGKTTLLRLIAGELTLDRDDKRKGPGVITDRMLTIRLLHQTPEGEKDRRVEELILRDGPENGRGDSAADHGQNREQHAQRLLEFERLITGLGFSKEDRTRKLSSFSGGEQTKLLLARELLRRPDILLLDEPTNHLDMEATEWLEAYLRSYDRAVVIVSHDRFFLDRVAEGVWELQNGRLTRYSGGYTQYRQQRRKALELQRKQFVRQQAELERLNALIEKFKHKPKKAAFARSRRSMIARMEKVPRPVEEESHIFVGAIEPESSCSKWVVKAEKLKIGYRKFGGGGNGQAAVPVSGGSGTGMEEGRPHAWNRGNIDFRIRRGQKIGIIGPNGVGKTTLLKTIAGLLEPLGGSCQLGERVKLGYFDQQSATLEEETTVFSHFRALFPAKTEKEVRQQLAAWLFKGRDGAKQIRELSGGEKSRLVLAELLTARPNFLLLDEPTNHMDIPAKETIESALSAYTGTLLFISHDRYFIRQVAESLLVMEGEELLYYPFGYEHYLKNRKRRGVRGESLSAVVRAEEKAMLEDYRAVPEPEKHRLREMSTEQASFEWQLGLAEEPMEAARRRVERLWRQCQDAREAAHEQSFFSPKSEQEQELGRLEALLEEAQEEWTRACLEWYDAYIG